MGRGKQGNGQQRLKITQVTTVDISMRFLIFDLLKHLKAQGYRVEGICAPGDHNAEVRAAGIRVIEVPMTRRITPLGDVAALVRLVRTLRRERPDVVHTHTPKANLLGQWAARIANIPVRICTIHGFYFTPQTPLPKRLAYQAIESASALFADVVFLVNRQDITTAKQLRVIRPSKLRLLEGGTGIDVQRFSKQTPDPAVLEGKRIELGLPPDAVVVGFVGRLVREKGLVELFEAFQALSAEFPDLWLLVVGPYDTAKPDSLTPASAQELGITERAIFTGMRKDTVDLYGLMDIFVLPSYREGMPGVAMEAQAMGLPVITTEARGCREAIVDGQTGLLVPVRDASALAGALRTLAADPALRAAMGEAGRALALKRFDQRKVFATIEQEYRRVYDRKAGTRRI